MPATISLSNIPVNSVFSHDQSQFSYRHVDFSIELCFLREVTHSWSIFFSNRQLK